MYLFLIIVGVILILYNAKKIKKDSASFNEILEDEKTNTSDIDITIGEIRREFSETILELQKEIMELSEKIDSLDRGQVTKVDEESSESTKNLNENIIDASEIPIREEDSSQTKEIAELLKTGVSAEEICKKFNIGRGEILLIKELYLK